MGVFSKGFVGLFSFNCPGIIYLFRLLVDKNSNSSKKTELETCNFREILDMQDNLILVDKKDNILGFKKKAKCHSGRGLLHRGFSIVIFNNRGELLSQQRSQYKQGWPFFWSNSCCSHPRKGERVLPAAKRRLREELGFTTNLKYIYKFYYRSIYKKTFSENEICYVLLGNYKDNDIKPDPKEVKDWQWIKIDRLREDIRKNPKNYTPWFKKIMKELGKQRIFEKRKTDDEKAIKVIIAKPHGFCGNENFGVTGAITTAQRTALEFPDNTYVLGEIVHNQHVIDWLEQEYGVRTVHSLDEIPEAATVIIRSHGAGPVVYEQAKARGLTIVDATCPLVAQAHKEVKKLAGEGKKILYIASDMKHDEALGTAAQAPEAVVLTTLEDLKNIQIENPKDTVVITQTTLSILETKEELEELKKRYPKIMVKPHICPATTQRQEAIIKLAKEIGFVIIVGSPTSSNSKRLREVAEMVGAKAYIVDTEKDLKPEWFAGIEKAAISSGASTPEWILEAVTKRIKTFNQ